MGTTIGLIGCVKEKASRAVAARDLYVSTLFRGRRSYVERSCDAWWILSAEHGLVDPSDVVAPYDQALKDLGRVDRRRWSRRVLDALDQAADLRAGDTVEIHAGAEYRDFGLVDGLLARGCMITNPTEGMRIGEQLRFYQHASPSRVVAERRVDLDRLYSLLADLEQRCGGKHRLVDCHGSDRWPQRGVYFFFEDGELRDDGVTSRVVRVGTHALRPSSSTLWGRLSQHRGTVGGSKPGGGNHRGSIFRLHTGTALLATRDWPESIRATWGQGSNASTDIRAHENPLEREVSTRIGAMPFLWLAVDDPPSAASARGVIEAGSIALLSNYRREPIDPPSSSWLGNFADRETIRSSGLWNVNHVRDSCNAGFLDTMKLFVRRMG